MEKTLIRVKKIVNELNQQKIDLKNDTDLFVCGLLDSFGMITIIGQLEDEFAISFDNEDLIVQNFNSIQSMAENIKKYL